MLQKDRLIYNLILNVKIKFKKNGTAKKLKLKDYIKKLL